KSDWVRLGVWLNRSYDLASETIIGGVIHRWPGFVLAAVVRRAWSIRFLGSCPVGLWCGLWIINHSVLPFRIIKQRSNRVVVTVLFCQAVPLAPDFVGIVLATLTRPPVPNFKTRLAEFLEQSAANLEPGRAI